MWLLSRALLGVRLSCSAEIPIGPDCASASLAEFRVSAVGAPSLSTRLGSRLNTAPEATACSCVYGWRSIVSMASCLIWRLCAAFVRLYLPYFGCELLLRCSSRWVAQFAPPPRRGSLTNLYASFSPASCGSKLLLSTNESRENAVTVLLPELHLKRCTYSLDRN